MPRELQLSSSGSEHQARAGLVRRFKTRKKILEAAFELFGSEAGLHVRIDDIAAKAGVSRATFYNHFKGMSELRAAIADELTYYFVTAVGRSVKHLVDPVERAACATRFYLEKGREDRRWAWAMINVSASGVILGSETSSRVERAIAEGMTQGAFRLRDSVLGRDIVLGATLGAISTMLRRETDEDYPQLMTGHILMGLGVEFDKAKAAANMPLPQLIMNE